MKKLFTKVAALGFAATAALSLAACSSSSDSASSSNAGGSFAENSDTLVFGAVPDSADTETNYQPLMDYIAKETGKKVEYKQSTDYAALIEAAVSGKIDVASFSGFTYVTAKNNGAELTPISSIVTKEGQEPGYYSEAIVPQNSSINSVADFKGKKVCFVSPSSTSGFLFPSYELLNQNIKVNADDPSQSDVTAVFAGKHDVSVQKVSEGTECEAGFAEDSEVEKAGDKVRVIDKVLVPGAPIVMNDALPQDVKDSLTKTLSDVTIKQIADAGIKDATSEGFASAFYETKPVDDKYYDTIRDICSKTNAKQCQG
ncbi:MULTISPECIES: phosphate/phosphite/phosphonate ABC transporter substrate-binding protein [unclassified Pseudoclavibacter]|uniref:phosphate/phosphite/phosphonate ABC transporter substrate-binding protein n=1 Tax=unclassified Pseudoclavibacter TaxID=2615177 RepID=UPI0013012536|nr:MULTISPECIES: phosphate/phosphite/phosphonate ABC transporter substrate-binding protein [unclassified Pseudoclavibacter]KAB1644545.1 phosphate/phosphite/phosphonate ABC transporter substrate-binding protein [Pseudoclavibacter sp. CFCC 14310]KAB1663953.1 phosphate/phosphite/phosphonate ABC transporter substrate-binding protein [Pseudoclavibacter sp. CFCC 13611]